MIEWPAKYKGTCGNGDEILFGYAGTGKTTLIRHLVEEARARVRQGQQESSMERAWRIWDTDPLESGPNGGTMSDRWSKRKRCEMCQEKKPLFAYDGFMICGDCKRTMRASDRQPGSGGNPPKSVRGCFS